MKLYSTWNQTPNTHKKKGLPINTGQKIGYSISKAMGIPGNPNPMVLTDFRKIPEHILLEFLAELFCKVRISRSSEVPIDKLRTQNNSFLHPPNILHSMVTHNSSFSGKGVYLLPDTTPEYSENQITVLKVQIIPWLIVWNCQGYNIPLVSSKIRCTQIEANVQTDWYRENVLGHLIKIYPVFSQDCL